MHGLAVLSVALALLGYVLLPVLHAVQHASSGPAAVQNIAGEASVRSACHHQSCGTKTESRPEDAPEPPQRHDHSSCAVCKALLAARKHLELPSGVVQAVPAPALVLWLTAAPEERKSGSQPLPRSARGPPLHV
jgi:hypothetical protein